MPLIQRRAGPYELLEDQEMSDSDALYEHLRTLKVKVPSGPQEIELINDGNSTLAAPAFVLRSLKP